MAISLIKRLIYFHIIIISASVICFEIVATRISSVIFVHDSAFIILSLAILGLGTGAIYSFYKIKPVNNIGASNVKPIVLTLFGLSQLLFILAVTNIEIITTPLVFFPLLFFPFFFAGIFFAQVFKTYAEHSYLLYAADLLGAAIGSILAIVTLNTLGASNSILLTINFVFISVIGLMVERLSKNIRIILYTALIISISLLIMKGSKSFLPAIPIGNFPEKDFYHVYPNPSVKSKVIDRRWSIHGRADLVEYNHQDMVKQLFVDGAAGSQMMRFGGDKERISPVLSSLLLQFSTSIPFLFLEEDEKNSMLVIGPGGGKEVLTGILQGVDEITGVEINPDFVNIVKDHRDFNGGIYTDFLNVKIYVKEGRHFIKQTNQNFDLIVMALASTEQLQNVDNFAMSENYLLTVEAIYDYLNILTLEGRLIFTVHNTFELQRLIVTTVQAFEKLGISSQEVLNHLVILEDEYAPTVVIKRETFTKAEMAHQVSIANNIPADFPQISYMPFVNTGMKNTRVNQMLNVLKSDRKSYQRYIDKQPYNIMACTDDSPYFYKISKGVPNYFKWLLVGISFLCLALIFIPLVKIKRKIQKTKFRQLINPLIIFITIGLGFMILEISLFQKLILFLGSPTISLSILLSSLLAGMGAGSYFGKYLFSNNIHKHLYITGLLIVIVGMLFFFIHPFILDKLLGQTLLLRAFVCVLMILPLAFLLGIPFPSAIQLLRENSLEEYIPWMYGINGAMSVLGSVISAVLSMLFGITMAFYIGLALYSVVFFYEFLAARSIKILVKLKS